MNKKFFLALIVVSANSFNTFCGEIFQFDIPEKAQGLRVCFTTDTARVENVTEEDLPFYHKILNDPEVIGKYASGTPIAQQATQNRIADSIHERFAKGHPTGLLTVKDKNDPSVRFGYVIAGRGDRPGVSEIACVIDKPYQKKGLVTGITTYFVNTIIPQIKEIGQGNTPIAHAFQCFGGKALECLDATASPSNEGSWKILDAAGFGPAQYKLIQEDPIVDFQKNCMRLQEMEKEIFQMKNIEMGKRYRLIDINGKLRTFSIHEKYKTVKFHFEKKI